MKSLPSHLQKYVVEQNYQKYTPVEQASWRYVLRQLTAFLREHAHESYLEGLKKTGISIEAIPRIEDISAKLEKFGWRAIPVSGFIPPAAFMELQSLGVLPIASDMRTLEHLSYTPAPDIVHEAAGHAPILIQPEFAEYLRQYAQIARKAIISKEDLDLYEAIRELSDVKENSDSSPEQVRSAEENLARVSKSISHVSEATELGRMNWWTAEYGLIGSLEDPRIFGAGLLSSVGEAKYCLSPSVRKLPLTVDCIRQGYDITEPQPQLFVTPDFATLSRVLQEMAEQMAFKKGGLVSVNKAIQAQSVNTVELNSGVQISGIVCEVLSPAHPSLEVAYLRFQGPCQLCFGDNQLPNHGPGYHNEGFGTPVGRLAKFPGTCPSQLSDSQWDSLGAGPGKTMDLEFVSGVKVRGFFNGRFENKGRTILLSLTEATVTYQGRVLFEPAWGTFDMAVGSQVTSVFGGPADRVGYGDTDDFAAKRVPQRQYSDEQKLFHAQYAKVRELRESGITGEALEDALRAVLQTHNEKFASDWLLRLEAYELLLARGNVSVAAGSGATPAGTAMATELQSALQKIAKRDAKTATLIQDGLTHAKI